MSQRNNKRQRDSSSDEGSDSGTSSAYRSFGSHTGGSSVGVDTRIATQNGSKKSAKYHLLTFKKPDRWPVHLSRSLLFNLFFSSEDDTVSDCIAIACCVAYEKSISDEHYHVLVDLGDNKRSAVQLYDWTMDRIDEQRTVIMLMLFLIC